MGLIELFLHFGGKGVFVYEDGDGFVAEIGFAGKEHAFVFTVVGAPTVLDHVVFVAHLVFGGAVDEH